MSGRAWVIVPSEDVKYPYGYPGLPVWNPLGPPPKNPNIVQQTLQAQWNESVQAASQLISNGVNTLANAAKAAVNTIVNTAKSVWNFLTHL